jgi:V-type ATPase 116kDa subunit family
MILLFGYMDFLIVYKWLTYWPDASVAPSIITTMINMPLKLGKTVIFYVFRMIAVEGSQCGVSMDQHHKTQYNIGSS